MALIMRCGTASNFAPPNLPLTKLLVADAAEAFAIQIAVVQDSLDLPSQFLDGETGLEGGGGENASELGGVVYGWWYIGFVSSQVSGLLLLLLRFLACTSQ
jgi:hypothetical protein